MVIDNPIILPVIGLALLAGVVACLYVVYRFLQNLGQDQKPASRKPAAPDQEQGQAVARTAQPGEPTANSGKVTPAPQLQTVPTPPSNVVPELPPDAIEMFRVLRVGSMGELVVEVDGQLFKKLTQIRDGTTGRRVLLAIQELSDFVGPHGQKPLPEMHRLTRTPRQASSGESRLDPEQLAFLSQIQDGTSADDPSRQSRMDLVQFWSKGLTRSGRGVSVGQTKSMVDELEEMLQLRLASRPELDTHSIHFRSTLKGEMRIEVDGGLYEVIDDVPYPQVVSLLRAIIRSWERG